MIIEAVLFSDELELLEARFDEGQDNVDLWVILEAAETFTGQPKPLCGYLNRDRYSYWKDRIIWQEVTLPSGTPWQREAAQRDGLHDIIDACDGTDIIVLCDGDELVAREDWDRICEMAMEGTVCFPQTQHYFTLCWSTPPVPPPAGGKMRRSRACRRDGIEKVSQWADGQYGMALETGWHLSCLGGPERLLKKLRSFSHTELSDPSWANEQNVVRMIRDGIDIDPTRNWPLTKVEPQGPPWLLTEGIRRWPWLLDGGIDE